MSFMEEGVISNIDVSSVEYRTTATVMHTKNTGSYWRDYTVKSVIIHYLVEKPVILIFQKFAEIV